MNKQQSRIWRWWVNRPLVGKQALLLLIATLIASPIAVFTLRGLVQPAFDRIERQQVHDQTARARHALREFEEGLQSTTLDYAVWDDMYEYVGAPSKAFELETLSPNRHFNNEINFRGVVDASGTVIWSSVVDLETAKVDVAASAAMKAVLADPVLQSRANASRSTINYVTTPGGIYLLSTVRIVKSDETGIPRGFMVNGILLRDECLSEALQVAVKLNRNLTPALARQLAMSPTRSRSTTTDGAIATNVGLLGTNGQLIASIEFSTPRSISAAGFSAVRLAAAAMLLAIAGLVAILSIGLRRVTVRRIQRLGVHVRDFKAGGAPLEEELTEGGDEIAQLAREFEALSVKLGHAEEQLRQRSYLQGKADSAAGMLHNVRNALAPIRVMQEKWLAEEKLPFRANMPRAAEELTGDGLDPARKADLEQFMLTAARQIALTRDGRLDEMYEAKESIDQIAGILSSYNFDMSGASGGDLIDLGALIRREAATVAARETGGFDLVMTDALPIVDGNRVHLGQVLDNILVNADEAMEAAGASPKTMTVSWVETPDGECIQVRFTDNGDGIAPENITKAFQRGYSTRNYKAGGLGMHWSANAMRAMGGSIALESEGPGAGTTAILTLRKARDAEQPETLREAA